MTINESILTDQHIDFKAPDVYSKLLWSREPNDDWETILRNRAQELRDSYKKIRLWYSGGADSHRVLMTFIENGIHIDEIAIKKKVPDIKVGDYEILDIAIPKIQSLQHLISNTKITIIDSTVDDYANFYSTPYWWETLIRPTEPFFGIAGCAEIGLGSNQFDPFAEDNCINIITRDKPYIIYVNDKWYAYWVDSNTGITDQPYAGAVSSFYIDSPDVHLKQCHMLKKYIEKTSSPDQYNRFISYKTTESQTHWNLGCGRIKTNAKTPIPKLWIKEKDNGQTHIQISGVQRPLYQSSVRKKEIMRISEFLNNGLEHIVTSWANTVLELSEFADGTWWNNGRAEDGYLGILSDFYCLTDGSIKTVNDLFPNGFARV